MADEKVRIKVSIKNKKIISTTNTMAQELDSPIVEELDLSKINFCHKCGNKLLENSMFCNKCGTKIPK